MYRLKIFADSFSFILYLDFYKFIIDYLMLNYKLSTLEMMPKQIIYTFYFKIHVCTYSLLVYLSSSTYRQPILHAKLFFQYWERNWNMITHHSLTVPLAYPCVDHMTTFCWENKKKINDRIWQKNIVEVWYMGNW